MSHSANDTSKNNINLIFAAKGTDVPDGLVNEGLNYRKGAK